MNILIFGWYGHRNAGDDRIQYCLTRWLDGHTLGFLPAGRNPPLRLLRSWDAAIIGGGGLIMREGGLFSRMRRWVRSAGIPVAIMGASVESITPGLRRELKDFLEVCCFACFRDQGSLDELGPHPKALVAPDLTWLYPYPELERRMDGVALNVRKHAGFPVGSWRRALAELGREVHPWPLYFEQGGDAAVLKELLPGRGLPEEFDPGLLDKAGTVVSGRYHGIQFALQAGRPVVAVGDLPKIRRFMEESGLGQWCISEAELGSLMELLKELEKHRMDVARQISTLRSRLCREARDKACLMRQRLLGAAASLPRPSRRWGSRLRDWLDLGSYF
ncbi:MAG: polysaccharide pyruvyl transferase family protein [Elusimicrobia bacterium]|nr:polysaccharide pyruvyl transferase family protein [Elusimicrobiota bacterium]